ncbi:MULTISPECIES: cyclic peptide export ABC transporter [unclassified Burkholderia]|uniref:cyclic peptide export ABC transporter n=1 Tax=unclassified Burkholderia TaxID=2613784 RepID=UPI000F573F9F|nr:MULTISPECIES: cyclic peptide export ABC transporter [unclassified Burkholderia]RQR70567.1 cyclic peptide export ABC transporter [Burkholderia sp. Bp9012]RQR77844.1 cyclic peptide export ABC transporter [Burkholderia sp. Bp9011]RQR87840.1 cyclic peptide export ABC transporter [Burkholderia sp. Bp9010]RQZ43780.1 cyclic peptide export ABC transporter [Burkholderia sp. Bp9099]
MLNLFGMLIREGPVLFSLASIGSALSGVATMGILVSMFVAMEGDAGVRWWHFALYGVLVIATRVVSRSILALITRRAVMTLRVNLARQIVDAPLDKLEHTGHSRLFASMAADVTRIGEAVPNTVNIFANLVFLVICFCYLGVMSPERLGIVLGMVGIGLVVHQWVSRRIAHCMRVARHAWDDLAITFDLLVYGVKELQLNARRRAQMLDTFRDNAHELKKAWQRQSVVFNFGQGFSQTIFFLALGLVIFDIHGRLLAQSAVVQYALSLIYMIGPLRDIVGSIPGLIDAGVAYERIEQMGFSLTTRTLADPKPDRTAGHDPSVPWQEIALHGIVYRYAGTDGGPQGAFRLGPIDLRLRRGDVVFIVGRNGSGKTTLAKLVTGLYVPDEGCITLDGTPVTEANRAHYREQFSAIFSDFVLFERVLETPGEACDARVDMLLKSLRIHDKVTVAGGRLSTVTALSLGERKRLALLTSYLDERPAYLFDEWAADQDPVFKAVFYEKILPDLRARGRLVLVVSHDDRYFRSGDTLIDLDQFPGARRRAATVVAGDADAPRFPGWLGVPAAGPAPDVLSEDAK